MMADIYGYSVQTTINKEGGALGAAILAAVGVGLYDSIQEAADKIIKANSTQEPIEENISKYEPYFELYKSIYPALKESFNKLSKI